MSYSILRISQIISAWKLDELDKPDKLDLAEYSSVLGYTKSNVAAELKKCCQEQPGAAISSQEQTGAGGAVRSRQERPRTPRSSQDQKHSQLAQLDQLVQIVWLVQIVNQIVWIVRLVWLVQLLS